MSGKAILVVSMALIIGTAVWAKEEVSEPVELTFGVYSSDKITERCQR